MNFSGFLLINLPFVFENKESSIWELDCVMQTGFCGSLGMVIWEFSQHETRFPKKKCLRTDAEWWAKVGKSTSMLVVLHCKLLKRHGLPVSFL